MDDRAECSVNEDLNGSREWSCASWSLTRVKYTLRHRVLFILQFFFHTSPRLSSFLFFFNPLSVLPYLRIPGTPSDRLSIRIRPALILMNLDRCRFLFLLFLLLLVALDFNDFDFLIMLDLFWGGFDEIIVTLTRRDLVETFDQIARLTLRCDKWKGIDRFESTNLLDGAHYGWLLIMRVYIIISKIIFKKSEIHIV